MAANREARTHAPSRCFGRCAGLFLSTVSCSGVTVAKRKGYLEAETPSGALHQAATEEDLFCSFPESPVTHTCDIVGHWPNLHSQLRVRGPCVQADQPCGHSSIMSEVRRLRPNNVHGDLHWHMVKFPRKYRLCGQPCPMLGAKT